MSTSDHKHSAGQKDYADTDIKVRPLLMFLIISLAITALTIIGVNLLMHHFNSEIADAEEFSNKFSLQRQLPEGGAILQGFEQAAADLKKLHTEEDALLNNYAWIDKQAGTVRIPVELAIEKSVEKGYPVRENPTPSVK